MNVPRVVNMNLGSKSLGFPKKSLPFIKDQKRKRQATISMPERKMIGADTETIGGKLWLFSTEKGVWEIDTFKDLMEVIFSPKHMSKWKKTKKSGRGNKLRGWSPVEFFFWNLKFDAQAIFRLLTPRVVESLIESKEEGREGELGQNKIRVNVHTGDFHPIVKGQMIELDYLEGKSFVIRPISVTKTTEHGTVYHIGTCYMWDISQFYGKLRLQTASEIYLGESKIETLFDGEILDASRFDDEEYRIKYRNDILDYAVKDADLAGRLARLKRSQFVESGVRFIRPYSLANVAQRNLLDMCQIPTVNKYSDNPALNHILSVSNTSYLGGRFETAGIGYLPDIQPVDLASAYPYTMFHLPNTDEGKWMRYFGKSSLLKWLERREPMSMGFIEGQFLFGTESEWNPLCTKLPSGSLVSPRLVRGWFTAEEVQEALKWPVVSFEIGDWTYFEEDGDDRPFQPFIDKYYRMKSSSPSDSVEYAVSKVMVNSVYGKTRQAVQGKAGKLWNPMYASTICGSTRARLAELVRVNNFSAKQLATDGVFFDTDDLVDIPNRPLPATLNLGQWELEDRGSMLCLGSGIYSMDLGHKVKTRFRGGASYFLRGTNLFDFCKENSEFSHVSKTIRRPYSAREAKVRDDMELMNVFRPVKQTMKTRGDSEKRRWKTQPSKFGDLLENWYDSYSHFTA